MFGVFKCNVVLYPWQHEVVSKG